VLSNFVHLSFAPSVGVQAMPWVQSSVALELYSFRWLPCGAAGDLELKVFIAFAVDLTFRVK
jgi:hypothetical protein